MSAEQGAAALQKLHADWVTPAERYIEHLPKISCRDCSQAPSRVCGRHEKRRCATCGNYLTTAHVDLDYLGHAGVTEALLSADPLWSWEPLAFCDNGLPLYEHDTNGNKRGLWIRLTVAGHTRLGYGTVEANKGPDAVKELIGDAIRNAAMRFGVALSLWAKADWPDTEPTEPTAAEEPTANAVPSEVAEAWVVRMNTCTDDETIRRGIKNRFVADFGVPHVVDHTRIAEVDAWLSAEIARITDQPVNGSELAAAEF